MAEQAPDVLTQCPCEETHRKRVIWLLAGIAVLALLGAFAADVRVGK